MILLSVTAVRISLPCVSSALQILQIGGRPGATENARSVSTSDQLSVRVSSARRLPKQKCWPSAR
jgi:hypothetical protein